MTATETYRNATTAAAADLEAAASRHNERQANAQNNAEKAAAADDWNTAQAAYEARMQQATEALTAAYA